MEVFHFVAHQLKDTPLFDAEIQPTQPTTSGSIYNDFDNSTSSLLYSRGEEWFCYSQVPPSQESNQTSDPIEEALDAAVMTTDAAEGVHYEHLQWESEYFDNYSEKDELEYYQKVYDLATKDEIWDEINISTEAITMFHRRLRTDWEGPDSVFDAWLIRNELQRSVWFDRHLFDTLFPDFVEVKDRPTKRRRIEDNEAANKDDKKRKEATGNVDNGNKTSGENNNQESEEKDDEENEDSKDKIVLFIQKVPIPDPVIIIDSDSE